MACTYRYLKLKFSEIPQAKRCVDELQDFREGVTVKQFTKDDSESMSLVMCCYIISSPSLLPSSRYCFYERHTVGMSASLCSCV